MRPEDALAPEEAIRKEVDMVYSSGWDVRRQRIMDLFTTDSTKLTLGLIADVTERERSVGRCQAYKQILDMDQQAISALEDLAAEENQKEELEGGDFPIGYEAAQ